MLLTLLLVACGSSGPEEPDAIQLQEDGTLRVLLSAGDDMRFNLNEIKASPGQTIHLSLTHTGRMSIQQMGHNAVFLKEGVNPDAFLARATAYADVSEMPIEMRNQILAATSMIGGRGNTEITFVAPDKEGTHFFVCTFPGHQRMRGVLVLTVPE